MFTGAEREQREVYTVNVKDDQSGVLYGSGLLAVVMKN